MKRTETVNGGEAVSEWTEKLPQNFDCHYDGDIARCDKDCAKLGVCKRRTAAPAVSEWKKVPVEPTDNMKSAAALLFTAERIEFQKTAERGATFCGPSPEAYYRAMLSAAPQPTEQEGWLRAIDEELVSAYLGVAVASDSYESAKKKLDELIRWHIAVATDPAVNGGMKLVPDSGREG